MVGADLLNEAIASAGVKKSYVARELGLTRQGFAKKSKNPESFTAEQITKICRVLRITSRAERDKIFFAPKVE